jgi:hypothetical protein
MAALPSENDRVALVSEIFMALPSWVRFYKIKKLET